MAARALTTVVSRLKYSYMMGLMVQTLVLPFQEKDVVSALNKKNYDNLANDTNIEVFNYKAQFKSNTEVNLLDEDGAIVHTLTADRIVINTGAKSNIPSIPVSKVLNIYLIHKVY